jgi:hypothetical protein
MKIAVGFPRLLTISGLLLCGIGCSSSTAIKDSDEFRKVAATKISKQTGVDTVWNQLAPPVVGGVYVRRKTSHGDFVFDESTNVFVKKLAPISQVDPLSTSWNYNIADKKSIKSQIEYIGFGGGVEVDSVKAISFSADGDTYRRIALWDGGTDSNDVILPGLAETLNQVAPEKFKERIYENTLAITDKKNRVAEESAEYWIVTAAVTVKNLNAKVATDAKGEAKLGAPDAKAFAEFLGLNNVASAAVGSSVSQSGTNSIVVKDPYAIVAVAYPILAKKNDSGLIILYTGKSTLRDSKRNNPLFGFIQF